MYPYFTFYTLLVTFTVASICMSIAVNTWIALLLTIPAITIALNRFRCFRVRCRAWSTAKAPHDEYDLKKACKEDVTVVGQSWSFFLQKRVPTNPVFTHNFASTKPDINGFWKSGTQIKTVAEYYEKDDLAFPSLPSYQNITLGGWIMTESHGSSGDTGAGSSSCFDEITFINKNNEKETLAYSAFEKEKAKCILYVSFKDLVDNIWLEKIKVDSFDEWLRNGAYQRACFIGKNQEVMIRWETAYTREKDIHEDLHTCSRFCLWFQADVCTACGCCCVEPNEKYNSYVRLAEVNRFVPFVFPLLSILVQDYANFEIILYNVTQEKVKEYYGTIQKFHKKYGGRTEIRYGKVLFLDVSLPRKHIEKYTTRVARGKYHAGKYKPKTSLAKVDLNGLKGLKLKF